MKGYKYENIKSNSLVFLSYDNIDMSDGDALFKIGV